MPYQDGSVKSHSDKKGDKQLVGQGEGLEWTRGAGKCSAEGLTSELCLKDVTKFVCWKSMRTLFSQKQKYGDTKNVAYLSFRCMILVQRGAAGKGMLDWGQTLKGF